MDKIKAFLLGIVMNKGVKSAAKLIVSWCFARGIVIAGAPFGIQLDSTNEGVMTVGINSLLKLAFAKIKEKYPGKFDWLP